MSRRMPDQGRARRWTIAAGLVAVVAAGAGTALAMGGGSARSACQGQALTFSAEGGAPGVTSNRFPAGTRLRITNLDNGKSATLPVVGVSGSCALLNSAAMEQLREPGKNLIRRNTVEVVSPAAATTSAQARPSGQQVCNGNTVTVSGDGGAPGATSDQFPVGTQLKITNLDNGKSTTVPVVGPSGSCALLNTAAFEQVREPGKFLIRRALIERV
ncbi:hypothetical protein AB0A74_31575 [Saccharothrix sp. NPDC042600]|uniref:hypothetical protein n=1 Tax=Saccharothrix TaxID=2071 RepID=UPI0033DA0352|nr:hypothetical protein GCM10017745_07800 [Saccharothrix mutabilis subsp. capreolus]